MRHCREVAICNQSYFPSCIHPSNILQSSHIHHQSSNNQTQELHGLESGALNTRVADPCHFDVAPAPEPNIFFEAPAPTYLLHARISCIGSIRPEVVFFILSTYFLHILVLYTYFLRFKDLFLSMVRSRSCGKFMAPAPQPC